MDCSYGSREQEHRSKPILIKSFMIIMITASLSSKASSGTIPQRGCFSLRAHLLLSSKVPPFWTAIPARCRLCRRRRSGTAGGDATEAAKTPISRSDETATRIEIIGIIIIAINERAAEKEWVRLVEIAGIKKRIKEWIVIIIRICSSVWILTVVVGPHRRSSCLVATSRYDRRQQQTRQNQFFKHTASLHC